MPKCKCVFDIELTSPFEELIQIAKKQFEAHGGKIAFENGKGKFSINIGGSELRGNMTLNGKSLNICLEEKPFFLSCSIIKSRLSQFL